MARRKKDDVFPAKTRDPAGKTVETITHAKVHPKALIDDLLKQSAAASAGDGSPRQQNLFDMFDRLPEGADKTDFYRHEQNWSNRMILGDSLQVMASLAKG